MLNARSHAEAGKSQKRTAQVWERTAGRRPASHPLKCQATYTQQHKETAMGTTIRQCSCKHNYQDKKYGDNNRVHNEGMKGDRCTVCGGVKSKSSSK
jgi:hypothetical protein